MTIPHDNVMHVQKDSDVLKLLRILTPQVIKKITKSNGGMGRVFLVDMLFQKNEPKIESVTEAKVTEVNSQINYSPVLKEESQTLSNNPKQTIETSSDEKIDVAVDPNDSLEKVGIFSARKMKEIQLAKEKKEAENTPSATIFLLEERRKLKQAQEKIKKSEVLELYSTSAKANVKESKNKNFTIAEDGEIFVESSSYKGGLINKRQY